MTIVMVLKKARSSTCSKQLIDGNFFVLSMPLNLPITHYWLLISSSPSNFPESFPFQNFSYSIIKIILLWCVVGTWGNLSILSGWRNNLLYGSWWKLIKVGKFSQIFSSFIGTPFPNNKGFLTISLVAQFWKNVWK